MDNFLEKLQKIILQELSKLAETPSDINEHLLTLKQYSDGCAHITEMGVREGISTWALLASKPNKLVCIDILWCDLSKISKVASHFGVNLQFIHDSTVRSGFEIEETDFLFIDTWHVYTQLKTELENI
jgi:predicted O-methyltransferase YrrM